MLNILFFGALILYLAATLLDFAGTAFKKEGLKNTAWYLLLAAAAIHFSYTAARGVTAGRVPLANQFEFASAFSLGIALVGILLKWRGKSELGWITVVTAPLAFLILSYAALQPREITELMPSLKSAWFTLHIGSAVFSYSGFGIAACVGLRYLIIEKKSDELSLNKLDALSYKMICFGFLLLSVVILSGCIWAEQAWSTFWSWDPKETWALITWIIYAMLLHQRIRKHWRGRKMAWCALIAFICVLFTFMGVNTLMSGLHSYA